MPGLDHLREDQEPRRRGWALADPDGSLDALRRTGSAACGRRRRRDPGDPRDELEQPGDVPGLPDDLEARAGERLASASRKRTLSSARTTRTGSPRAPMSPPAGLLTDEGPADGRDAIARPAKAGARAGSAPPEAVVA